MNAGIGNRGEQRSQHMQQNWQLVAQPQKFPDQQLISSDTQEDFRWRVRIRSPRVGDESPRDKAFKESEGPAAFGDWRDARFSLARMRANGERRIREVGSDC